MSIIIKTTKEIEILREGGLRLASVLYKVKEKIKPGISTKELDDYASKLILEMGDTPAFLHYRPEGANKPFPASLCVSVNSEVVHGIPRKDKILQEGDIVGLDLGVEYKGYYTDSAITVPVGNVSDKALHLIDTAKRCLEVALKAKAGQFIGDIGYGIESTAKL